jgi:hypothetical protein
MGVGRITVQRWKRVDVGGELDWEMLRSATSPKAPQNPKVVKLVQSADRATAKKPAAHVSPDRIKDLETLWDSLITCSKSLNEARDLAAITGAIVRVDERLETIAPASAQELVDRMLYRAKEQGLTPRDLAQLMRRQWPRNEA